MRSSLPNVQVRLVIFLACCLGEDACSCLFVAAVFELYMAYFIKVIKFDLGNFKLRQSVNLRQVDNAFLRPSGLMSAGGLSNQICEGRVVEFCSAI